MGARHPPYGTIRAMRWTKRIMLAYLVGIGAIVVVAVFGLVTAPPVERDPGTFYEAYWNTAQTFDSAKAYDTVSSKMVDQCVEALYEYDGFDPDFTIVPVLAAAMPEISADGRVYTIRLRPNICYPARWSDGTPVEPWRDEPATSAPGTSPSHSSGSPTSTPPRTTTPRSCRARSSAPRRSGRPPSSARSTSGATTTSSWPASRRSTP